MASVSVILDPTDTTSSLVKVLLGPSNVDFAYSTGVSLDSLGMLEESRSRLPAGMDTTADGSSLISISLAWNVTWSGLIFQDGSVDSGSLIHADCLDLSVGLLMVTETFCTGMPPDFVESAKLKTSVTVPSGWSLIASPGVRV